MAQEQDGSRRLELIIEIARERLKLNPNDADALFTMAAAQGTLNDAEGGVQSLERLTEIDPNYPGLWLLKTKLYVILGEADKARESRLRALEAEPESARGARPAFPCPICEAPVAADARTCENCGVKFEPGQKLEDELDALGHAAIQELVQEELGVDARPEPARLGVETTPMPKALEPPTPKPVRKRAAERGLTNGLVLEARRGPRVGKTNGMKGRTNGLASGVGRTNGLTNGLGRTNGLTEGIGRTNGLTNGLGRTNGLGSGSPSAAAFRASPRYGGSHRAGWKLYLIPLVGAALLLLPLFLLPESVAPAYPIRIDGQFADWSGVPRFPQAAAVANPNVDISQVALVDNIDFLSFYIAVRGVALQGDPSPTRITDAFYVFIDVDRSAATGYAVQGLGADRRIEIDGWGGQVVGATLTEFDANRDAGDWGGWFKATSVAAAASGNEIEFEADWVGIVQPKASVEAAFAARSWDGVQVVAGTTGTSATPYVLVSQQTAAPQLASGTQSAIAQFTFQAVGGDVTVTSLNVTLSGSFAASTFSSIALADTGGNALAQSPVVGSRAAFSALSLAVPAGGSVSVFVRPAIAQDDGTTVGALLARVADVVAGPAGVSFVDPVDAPTSLAYVGTIPSASRVDGGFAEWTNLTTDPTGDVTPIETPDLDITRYAFQASAGDVFFMVQTAGTALNGTLVPSANRPYTGSGTAPDSDRDGVPDSVDPLPYDFNNDGVSDAASSGDYDADGMTDYGYVGGTDFWLNTTIPSTFPAPYAGRFVSVFIGPVQRPVERGEDLARFYLDLDGSAATGYAAGGIGADYLVEVGGKEGRVLSSAAMRFNGSNPGEWSWTGLGPAPVAKDRARLEAALVGITLTNASRAFIAMRGWDGRLDEGGTVRPAFVAGLGLMYSTPVGVGGDPTGITDTSSASTSTGGPNQRNVFYDGTNFWAFYFDGSDIQYEPSTNGLDWVGTKNLAFTTTSVRRVSTWFYDAGATKIVYIVGDTGAGSAVRVRRGTISGTTITWGTETQVTISSQASDRTPFISRDSGGYVWIASNNKQSNGNYRFSAVRSTNPDDVSTWPGFTSISNSVNNDFVQGLILPLNAADMYAIWYADGTIIGRVYTSGSWGTTDTIDTTSAGVLTKAPSATVDPSFNIHFVYVDSSGAVRYRQRTSSWQAATTLDSGSGNTYATISRDTGTGDLYAFWISSTNQINAQKYSGSWSPMTLETNTNAKSRLTSIDNAGASANVAWAWTQGSGSPWDVKFSVLSSSLTSRTIDTSTDSTPVGYSHQRKLFFDGAHYWAFYFDGTNTVYTSSADASTWENAVSQAFTTAGVDNPSVWYYDGGATKIVYAVGDDTANDNQVFVRRGTLSGTTIAWGSQATVQVSIANHPSKVAFITRDSNGYLWVAANSAASSSTYNVGVTKSTIADDVTSWGSVTNIRDTSISVNYVFPTIVPLLGGNMYAVWYADGIIEGKEFTGTWGTQDTIDTTTAGVATKIPSAVSDSSGNVHLVEISSSGTVLYRKRTSFWNFPTTLDSTSGSTSPTITLNTANGDLYAFWIAGSYQIKGKRFAGSWTDITAIETSTITKASLTSPYSYSGESPGFLWDQGASSPYEIKIQYIPEFQDLLLPIASTAVLVGWFVRRRRNATARGGPTRRRAISVDGTSSAHDEGDVPRQ